MNSSRADLFGNEAVSPPDDASAPLLLDHSEFNVIFVHSRLDDYGLSAAVFRVYCHLARRAGKGAAYPSVKTTAEVCRLHPQTVRAALRILTAHRLLTRQDRPGATSLYRLTPPSQWQPPTHINGHPSETDTPPSPSESTPPKRRQAHPSETNPGKGNPVEGDPKKVIPAPTAPVPAEAEAIMALWNSSIQLPKIQKFTDNRLKTLQARLADSFFRANWRAGVKRVAESPYCTGHNQKAWKADLDWFLRPDTLTWIMEGKYDDRIQSRQTKQQPAPRKYDTTNF